MRLLDLFCGAGGASMGYHRAGFEVVGVDIDPQPNYPFEFHQADALKFPLDGFDAIHASPPCQAFSTFNALWQNDHPDLILPTRTRLIEAGVPYVIENVMGAPLRDDAVRLCGSMFDLPVERHRRFECSFPVERPACRHGRWEELWPEGFEKSISKARVAAGAAPRAKTVGVWGDGGGKGKNLATWRWAMGIDWMTKREIAESIPPAYTEFIGRQLYAYVQGGGYEEMAGQARPDCA